MKGVSPRITTILMLIITICLVIFSWYGFVGMSEVHPEPLLEEMVSYPIPLQDKFFVDRYNKSKINIKEILGNATYQIQDDLKTICQHINKTHFVCEPKIKDCYCEFYIAEVEFSADNRTCLLIDDSCKYTNLPLSIESPPIFSYPYDKYRGLIPLSHYIDFFCYLT